MRSRKTLAVWLPTLLLCISPLTAEPLVRRGVDLFVTPPDGRTYYDFARNPIPAGFFCRDSKVFAERVAFKGLPLATAKPGQLWNADTVIERLDDAAFDKDNFATTRLVFRALSLVSLKPIKTTCGAFHVYVTLGSPQRVTRMNIRRTEAEGGSFTAPLAVDARLRFISVRPAAGKALRPLELTAAFTFPAVPKRWSFVDGGMTKGRGAVVDTDGDLIPDTQLAGTSNFTPGRAPSWLKSDGCPVCIPLPVSECHYDEGHLHCYYPPPPPGCPANYCYS